MRYKQPWCSMSATFPILLLSAFEGGFLNSDRGAHCDNLMSQPAMQALAMRSHPPFGARKLPPGCLVPSTVVPGALALLHAAFRIVVVGIVGPPLPFQVPLHPAFLLRVGLQRLAECDQACLCLLWHQCQCRGSDIKTDGVAPWLMFGLLECMPRQNELDEIALPITIGSFGLRRGGRTPHQTHILDGVPQSMLDHWISPVNEGGQNLLISDEKTAISGVGIQHKAHANIIAFPFHAVDPVPFTFETHPFGLAQTNPIDGMIRPTGEGLCHRRIEMLGHPGNPRRFGILVQVVFGKVMCLPQEGEGGGPLLLLATRKGTGRLPRRISTHAPHPLLGFPSKAL